MATVDMAKLQGTATRMIGMFGRRAYLRPLVEDDDASQDQAVTAIISDYGVREREGMLISPLDRRALVDAGSMTPDPEAHALILDGQRYRIVTVRTVNPGGTNMYFDCQVRR
jgi:hypothetical protein